MVPYLDDLLIKAPTMMQANRDTQTCIQVLTQHSWLFNHRKSSLNPSQTIMFLGLQFDSLNQSVLITRQGSQTGNYNPGISSHRDSFSRALNAIPFARFHLRPLQHNLWNKNHKDLQQLIPIHPEVDLLASRHGRKVPLYCAKTKDPRAAFIDTLVTSWNFMMVYTFLLFLILPRIIKKIKFSNTTMVQLAPNWPNRVWYKDLVQLSIANR